MKPCFFSALLSAAAVFIMCNSYPDQPPGDFSLTLAGSVNSGSPLLFTRYLFTYQTGQDRFDDIHAYTSPAGFIDTAFVNQSLRGSAVKNGSVYFTRTGQCRFYVEGRTGDNRRFADSCSVTIVNPFSIAGDTVIGVGETAKFSLVPLPDTGCMAPAVQIEWKVNGIPAEVDAIAGTFSLPGYVAGTYSIIASMGSFADTSLVKTFSTALDTFPLNVEYRVKTVAFGNGTGTISPASPCVPSGGSRIFAFIPNSGSIIAKVFKGTAQIPVAAACTLSNVTSPDSVRVMFFAVPKLLKPIPSKDITFTMGDDGLPGCGPAHSVTITYDFFMDSTEVTQKDYRSLTDSNPSYFTNDMNQPVEQAQLTEVVLYCNSRSKRDGLDTVYSYTSNTESPGPPGVIFVKLVNLTTDYSAAGYRLPTEAEWEFACRAGTTTDYYWGRNAPPATFDDSLAIDSNAVYGIIRQTSSPHPVATKKPNAFGLYDMSGNVWEFCNGWREAYTGEASIDPVGPPIGSWHILRGGSWEPQWSVESAIRMNANTDNVYDKSFGFRVVLPSR